MTINFTKLVSGRWLFVMLLFMFCAANLQAQNKSISGKVTDAANGDALPGVSIHIKGMATGTTTDANGNFKISVKSGEVLVVSMIGYKSTEVTIADQSVYAISLHSTSAALSEVVVVGFGERQKKDVVSAISTVGAKDIEQSTAISPELALQGKAAGVQVTSAGGDPSARPTVRIRGVGTFNDADPLYVIDGIPVAEGGAGATLDGVNDPTRRTPINIYTIISPDDIESISVLKDASAAAIYGVRAANGVILITTKSGKKGRIRVDFDGRQGSESVPKTYKVLNTQQFTQFYTAAYNANPQLNGTTPVPIGQATYFGPVWDPASTQYLGNSATYDWQHAIINKNAQVRDYNIRISGGSDNTDYNFSGGYSHNDAPFTGVNTERYSVSSNINTKIGDYIKAGINIRLVQETLNEVAASGITTDLSIFKAAPWEPIYDPTNQFGYQAIWKLSGAITPSSFNISPLFGPQYVAAGNYLAAAQLTSDQFKNQTVFGTAYLEIDPFAGLKIKGSYSGQQYTINNVSYGDFNFWQFSQTPSNPYSGAPAALQLPGVTPNGLSYTSGVTQNTIAAIDLDYQHSFGKHNFDITLDASDQKYNWVNINESTAIASSQPSLRYFNATGTEKAAYTLNGIYRLIGFLGRISYNYNSEFYFEGVVRRDGSSRFAPGHQWGTFPSASVAWRITQEDFMKNITFINDLKLRGGYGVLGNEQTTGGFQYAPIANINPPSYNLGTGNQTNNLGIGFPTFPNVNLSWEKVKQADIGFDAVLFRNFTFTAEYYHKVTNGIIQTVSLAPSSGIEGQAQVNIASVLNRGFEFQVGYNNTFDGVNVNLSANLTTQHNEVLSLLNNQDIWGAGLAVGHSMGFIYGYKEGGIFQSQQQVTDWQAKYHDVNITQQAPGDIYFQDLYGQPTAGSSKKNNAKDGVIDGNDQTDLGNRIPKFYYGFTAGIGYKGFDLNAFFQGIGSVYKYDNARALGESMSGYGSNQWVTVLNSWTPENHSTTMPRAVYQDPAGNNRVSNRFVESAAYLRLQNLQLGYTLPKSILEHTKVFQKLHVYVSGINLFTITKYKGLDPENDFYPSTRQFILGVNASF